MINSGERGFGLAKFSAQERTRRWDRVRELMSQAKLGAISAATVYLARFPSASLAVSQADEATARGKAR